MIVLFSVRFLDTCTRHFVKESKRKFRRLIRFSLTSRDVNLKQMVRKNAGDTHKKLSLNPLLLKDISLVTII